MTLERARVGEAAAIAALRVAANQDLTARYGRGHWSGNVTDRWVRFRMRNGTVYVARRRGRVVATLALCARKPWSIDRSRFTPVERPLYLVDMAVAPEWQRKGVGRKCLEDTFAICRQLPADAIYLDAYDARAGAGGFYRACGFRRVGRTSYRGVPLIYFEWLVAPARRA